MKPLSSFPQVVASTLAAFERMVGHCRNRRNALKVELGLLRVKARLMGVKDETHWLVAQFIVPREAEYAALDAQILMMESKLEEVRRSSAAMIRSMAEPPPAPDPRAPLPRSPSVVWLETGSPTELALMV